jgi:methionyl-tRNA formyltransferase
MKSSETLVFFGSGPVAAKTLLNLHGAGFVFEAIITKPRAPGFRGEVPVIELAQTWQIPYFTPANKAELSELFASHHFASPLGLVVDYGLIINKDVIDAFLKGIVNSHFSLLPEWRGADPITFAILSGQQETGVSIMLIVEKLDEGPLLTQGNYTIPPDITIQQLTHDLVELSNTLLRRTLPAYLSGKLRPHPQPDKPATYSRKIKKEDGLLDWHKPAKVLEREVRAFLGWPKSYTTLFGHQVIVIKARVTANAQDGALVMTCQPGWLEIQELIGPSGRTMSGADFLRGYKRN